MSAAWKTLERRVCTALGSDRVLGNRGSGIPDCDERCTFAVEVKHGYEKYRLPAAWLDQAKRNAKVSGRPWLLVQAPKYGKPVVTLDFEEFCRLVEHAA